MVNFRNIDGVSPINFDGNKARKSDDVPEDITRFGDGNFDIGDRTNFRSEIADKPLTPEQLAYLSADTKPVEDGESINGNSDNNKGEVKGHYNKPGYTIEKHYKQSDDEWTEVSKYSYESGKLTITKEEGGTETFTIPETMRETIEAVNDWNTPEAQNLLNSLRKLAKAKAREGAAKVDSMTNATHAAATIKEDANRYGAAGRIINSESEKMKYVLDAINGNSDIDISDVEITPANKQYISTILTDDLNSLFEKYSENTPENNAMKNEIYKLMIKGSEELIKDTEKEMKSNPNNKELNVKLSVYKQQLKTYNNMYERSGLKQKQTEFEKVMTRIGNVASTVLDTLNATHPGEGLTNAAGIFNAIVAATKSDIPKKDVKEFKKAADDAKKAADEAKKAKETEKFDRRKRIAEAEKGAIDAEKELEKAKNGSSEQEKIDAEIALLEAQKRLKELRNENSDTETSNDDSNDDSSSEE